jgi:hypothetical protein
MGDKGAFKKLAKLTSVTKKTNKKIKPQNIFD